MFKFLYKKIIKPVLFLFPADYVHTFFLKTGNALGRGVVYKKLTNYFFNYKNKNLSQNILDLNFENPIGLAAGFDYDADLINILPDVGFGFHTIGTVTNMSYEGNAFPMLDRLPKSKSLIVNKGFKSNGIDSVLEKIKYSKKTIPLGVSLGVTNRKYESEAEMIEDIYEDFVKANNSDCFDYFELNISCPNLIHLPEDFEKFDTPNGLRNVLTKLSLLNITRPTFIKMHCEKSVEDTIVLCEIAKEFHFIKGFIFSNLVKNRNNSLLDKDELKKFENRKGNFSGKPTENLSNNLISEVYKKYKDENRFIIIGCGGVFEGKDAYEKIKRGASLIQMITGMIYEGPSQIGNINKELSELVKKDGYQNIKEAIGINHK